MTVSMSEQTMEIIERGSEQSGAGFSPCGTWRYTLWRQWGDGEGIAAFIGLNPSTADECQDDPTVRRCINFARQWGYGGMVMLNIFAYRATDPKLMKAAKDPVGPLNDEVLRERCGAADVAVACWGTHGAHQGRAADVAGALVGLSCLGLTKAGHPKHPLYLRGDTEPITFPGYPG
jgi:hypothetical protein